MLHKNNLLLFKIRNARLQWKNKVWISLGEFPHWDLNLQGTHQRTCL